MDRNTPYTDAGLHRFDLLPPDAAAVMAWTSSGPSPEWHERAKQTVRDAMPLLARALDRAAREQLGDPETP